MARPVYLHIFRQGSADQWAIHVRKIRQQPIPAPEGAQTYIGYLSAQSADKRSDDMIRMFLTQMGNNSKFPTYNPQTLQEVEQLLKDRAGVDDYNSMSWDNIATDSGVEQRGLDDKKNTQGVKGVQGATSEHMNFIGQLRKYIVQQMSLYMLKTYPDRMPDQSKKEFARGIAKYKQATKNLINFDNIDVPASSIEDIENFDKIEEQLDSIEKAFNKTAHEMIPNQLKQVADILKQVYGDMIEIDIDSISSDIPEINNVLQKIASKKEGASDKNRENLENLESKLKSVEKDFKSQKISDKEAKQMINNIDNIVSALPDGSKGSQQQDKEAPLKVKDPIKRPLPAGMEEPTGNVKKPPLKKGVPFDKKKGLNYQKVANRYNKMIDKLPENIKPKVKKNIFDVLMKSGRQVSDEEYKKFMAYLDRVSKQTGVKAESFSDFCAKIAAPKLSTIIATETIQKSKDIYSFKMFTEGVAGEGKGFLVLFITTPSDALVSMGINDDFLNFITEAEQPGNVHQAFSLVIGGPATHSDIATLVAKTSEKGIQVPTTADDDIGNEFLPGQGAGYSGYFRGEEPEAEEPTGTFAQVQSDIKDQFGQRSVKPTGSFAKYFNQRSAQ